MADKTKIEWTDSTWNPITGCSKISTGCKYCYAERFAIRGMGQFSKDPKRKFSDILFHADKLTDPIKWKKPRMIFVCSMADLFHPDISFDTIDIIFEVMFKAEQHIFQVVTKRPERMFEFYKWYDKTYTAWKQRNIWLGVSVENQETADERIPILAKIPTYIRFISAEPLIGPIDLNQPIERNIDIKYIETIQWVIAGGESGPKARPSHPDWFRQLRDQSSAANVPFFFKQWGEWFPGNGEMKRVGRRVAGRSLDYQQWDGFPALAKDHFDNYNRP